MYNKIAWRNEDTSNLILERKRREKSLFSYLTDHFLTRGKKNPKPRLNKIRIFYPEKEES